MVSISKIIPLCLGLLTIPPTTATASLDQLIASSGSCDHHCHQSRDTDCCDQRHHHRHCDSSSDDRHSSSDEHHSSSDDRHRHRDSRHDHKHHHHHRECCEPQRSYQEYYERAQELYREYQEAYRTAYEVYQEQSRPCYPIRRIYPCKEVCPPKKKERNHCCKPVDPCKKEKPRHCEHSSSESFSEEGSCSSVDRECAPKKRHEKKQWQDLLFVSSCFCTPTPLPLDGCGTAIPFLHGLEERKGHAISKVSDTQFKLNESGFYFIEVSIYPDDCSSTENAFGLRAKDCKGCPLFKSSPVVQNDNSPIVFQQIYKVDCKRPQLLEVVGYGDDCFVFSEGRGASITIFKLSDLADSHKRPHRRHHRKDKWCGSHPYGGVAELELGEELSPLRG